MRHSAIRVLAILLTLAIATSAVSRARAAAPKDDAPAKKGTDTKDKMPAKEVDRLPNYYGPVVNPEQRIEIYTIQDDYRDRIAALKSQLDATVAERDAKIEAVLTPAQRKQVREAEAESKAKSKDRKADAEETPAATSAEKPAATKPAAKESEKGAAPKTSPPKTPAAKPATGKAPAGK